MLLMTDADLCSTFLFLPQTNVAAVASSLVLWFELPELAGVLNKAWVNKLCDCWSKTEEEERGMAG